MEIPIEQPTGKVKANFVRILPNDPRYQRMTRAERAQNSRMPLFRGTISSPDVPEEFYEFAVWDYEGKEGKTFLAGPVRRLSTRAGVEDHLAAARMSVEEAAKIDPEKVNPETGEIEGNPYELNPGTIIIRLNNAKVLKSDPSFVSLDAQAAELNDRRPLYWLKWQRGAGDKEVRGSLWDRAGRYGPFLDGNTQYPLTRDEAKTISEAAGQLPLGSSKKRGSRGETDAEISR